MLFLKKDKFRIHWRKYTSEDHQRANGGSYREEASESGCESLEQLRREGIEDWMEYLDGLESKVEIECMDSHVDEIKVCFPFRTL